MKISWYVIGNTIGSTKPRRLLWCIDLLTLFSAEISNYTNYKMRCVSKLTETETNGRHLADDIFKCIFLNENVWIPIKISLTFVPKGRINNIPAVVQIMAWHRPGDKPLSEPLMVSLRTHICVTRPQWVNKPSLVQITSRRLFIDKSLSEKMSDHYGDVIMGTITSQITSLMIVYSTVYSDADRRIHRSSASLAFVRGIHRGPVNSPHKWPVARKMFPFDDVIMF